MLHSSLIYFYPIHQTLIDIDFFFNKISAYPYVFEFDYVTPPVFQITRR
ncbi:hypothetical protein VCHC61A2_1262 [Vibrio cholerae HC-61A2]|nr:hypothetical protein VCHC61A2_1262 [Vibrio cholerae HC-61A2]